MTNERSRAFKSVENITVEETISAMYIKMKENEILPDDIKESWQNKYSFL